MISFNKDPASDSSIMRICYGMGNSAHHEVMKKHKKH
jgi:hypothetical protein